MREVDMDASWLLRKDLPHVLRLDEEWSEDDYLTALRKRSMIAKVVRMATDGPIVGHILYELANKRFSIHRFGVDPLFRRLGVGSMMAGALQRRVGGAYHRSLVDMWVPDGSLDIHLFLQAKGFRAEDIEEDRYRFVYHAPPDPT